MIKKLLFSIFIISFFSISSKAQDEFHLPKWLHESEYELIDDYRQSLQSKSGITSTNPPNFPVRTMAEWEEIESVMIAWKSYPGILRQIVEIAQQECEVIILAQDTNFVKNNLITNNISLNNVSLVEYNTNTIWIRDYGPTTVYKNDVEERILVNWIYDRPRPRDNDASFTIADFKDIDLYSTIEAPNDLVNTGGNFHIDGMGTAFASELVIEENGSDGIYNLSDKNEAQINQIMNDFMGNDRYIKFTALPYDGINHIDMHFIPLDEETILVGQFPEGISDGPQIEANIQYLLSNYETPYGNPYDIIRIPMPPNAAGSSYPGSPFGNAYYRTYANMTIINNSIIVPIYREEFDTTALRIIREAMPGYNVVGIDVDNQNETLISQGGAIHCITKTLGVSDPLLIQHSKLRGPFTNQENYEVVATIKHNSGISSATVYYTTDTAQGFINQVSMSVLNATQSIWTAEIPSQEAESTVFYYIHAQANSGKDQVRPLPAPAGFWKFNIIEGEAEENEEEQEEQEELDPTSIFEQSHNNMLLSVYPNPAGAITVVPLDISKATNGSLRMYNVLGQNVLVLHEGTFEAGQKNYFFNASDLSSGIYFIELDVNEGKFIQKISVK